MIIEIEEAKENTYLISEEFGFRYWIWFDELEKFDKSKIKEYSELSSASSRNFPGTLLEVSIIAFKSNVDNEVVYIDTDTDSNKEIKVNEEKLKSSAYGFKTEKGCRLFSIESLNIFGVDCSID